MTARLNTDSSLVKRILAGVVLGPVIVGIFWWGREMLAVFLIGLVLIGQWELAGMMPEHITLRHRILFHTAASVMLGDALIWGGAHIAGVLVGVLIAVFFLEIVAGHAHRFDTASRALFIVLYPALPMVYLMKLGRVVFEGYPSSGRHIVLGLLAAMWVFDSASYFTGMALGKHPFFPSISPKKTIEGFIGGICAVALAGGLVGYFLVPGYGAHIGIAALIAGFAGQTGDLAESVIKREQGVKDSSHLIPGHGGILDRFDSLLFAAPAVYGFLVLIRSCGGCSW